MLEIRGLSEWSEAHVWVSPEQHGTITAVFKNQIDWIPLSIGSVRPSQGRTLAIAQVPHTHHGLNIDTPTRAPPGACDACLQWSSLPASCAGSCHDPRCNHRPHTGAAFVDCGVDVLS